MTGHNSVAADQLRLFIERIETMEEEKKVLSEEMRGVYAEAKGEGFDVKTMRRIVQLRKMGSAARSEQEMLLDTYKNALGLEV